MSYKLTPQHTKQVLLAPSDERTAYLVEKAVEHGKLWGARGEQGWLVPMTGEKLEYFPIWPHPDFATKAIAERFEGFEAEEIELEHFISHWLHLFQKDGVKVACFPDNKWMFWLIEPEDLTDYFDREIKDR